MFATGPLGRPDCGGTLALPAADAKAGKAAIAGRFPDRSETIFNPTAFDRQEPGRLRSRAFGSEATELLRVLA